MVVKGLATHLEARLAIHLTLTRTSSLLYTWNLLAITVGNQYCFPVGAPDNTLKKSISRQKLWVKLPGMDTWAC